MSLTAQDVVLVEAAVFFTKETRHCDLAKLMSLLYLFDTGHYRQTGRSATGGIYKAHLRGPFNAVLALGLATPGSTISTYVKPAGPGVTAEDLVITPRISFNALDMTRRQMDLLASISVTYAEHTADEIWLAAFARSPAWRAVLANGAEKAIDYEMATRDRVRYTPDFPTTEQLPADTRSFGG